MENPEKNPIISDDKRQRANRQDSSEQGVSPQNRSQKFKTPLGTKKPVIFYFFQLGFTLLGLKWPAKRACAHAPTNFFLFPFFLILHRRSPDQYLFFSAYIGLSLHIATSCHRLIPPFNSSFFHLYPPLLIFDFTLIA